MKEQEEQWLVEVSYIDNFGVIQFISDNYYGDKPQRSTIITELVPKGCQTTGIHITKN